MCVSRCDNILKLKNKFAWQAKFNLSFMPSQKPESRSSMKDIYNIEYLFLHEIRKSFKKKPRIQAHLLP